MTLARHIGVKIVADGQDVTQNLSPYLKSITYTDNLSGEADTAEIEVADANRIFVADWFPKRGITVSITLIREYWDGGEVETLPLDSWECDEITNSYPPNVARIKLNSIAQNSGLRQKDESHAWENVKLSQIAADVAKKAGVELFYDTPEDPTIKRAEQSEMSALTFLQKLCTDNGLALKVSDGKLIIFDEVKLEQQEPVSTLTYDLSVIKNFSATATLQEIYKSCEVVYKHGQKDEKITGKFDDGSKSEGKVLKINQKVESQAEAEKLAKKKLRDKNKDEIKVNLTTTGRFDYVAGNVIELKDHGFYSGRYIIEKATHTIGTSGYTVSLELRKCLNGY
ncbi:MAG: hypothetical protein IJG24_03050 [Selenomonadaceae bacterium]|nr:hypothetical protein [Selenomonadaceae bacterium]